MNSAGNDESNAKNKSDDDGRYRTKHFGDKVGANFQLNIENIGENGRLQSIGAFPDGTPNAHRIVDLQKFFLSASFDL